MEIEQSLGADIIMAFDQCTKYGISHEEASNAMNRTLAWVDRCKSAKHRQDQMLFPIVQGNMYEDLRLESPNMPSVE